MAITDPHVLPPDLVIVPVAELDDDVRSLLQGSDGDLAVTRPRSRATPKIVDARAGELLESFRSARTITDAVLAFSARHELDPEHLLAESFPLLQQFVSAGLLVEAGSKRAMRIIASLQAGDRVSAWAILRCVHILEDVELYQVRADDGRIAAIKMARGNGPRATAMLRREAAVLERLRGVAAPALCETGVRDGLPFLVMEWMTGVDAGVAAQELRAARDASSARRLLQLCHNVAAAYATLHAAGVFHGDVHEGNLLVDAGGAVTIIDYGLARLTGAEEHRPPRGGIGAYFEPEYARAVLSDEPAPSVTAAAEQYSVAAMLYALYTGTTYLEFGAQMDVALGQIAADPPLAFARRGLAPFPAFERVLSRSLNKDPVQRFGATSDLARAIRDVMDASPDRDGSVASTASRARLPHTALDAFLEGVRPGAALWPSDVMQPPTANVNFGAAGIAYALYRIALVRDDAPLLALADLWATRAASMARSPHAFYNPELELTSESVGRASLYHTRCGIHVVRALIARAMSDEAGMDAAVTGFVGACRSRGPYFDLTLGRAGLLLGCSLLIEAIPADQCSELHTVIALGNRLDRELWQRFETAPPVGELPFRALGIAHGWAGVLFAILRWRRAVRAPIDLSPGAPIPLRLHQLARLAEPVGRGVRWPWLNDDDPGHHGYMPGWCSGSAGYVHLWLLAHALSDDTRWLGLAERAAWNAWEYESEEATDLCCGLAGRAYALLALYRVTGDSAWLRRASELVQNALPDEAAPVDWTARGTSLYKGDLGAQLLIAELDVPEVARMPLFEDEGWPRTR